MSGTLINAHLKKIPSFVSKCSVLFIMINKVKTILRNKRLMKYFIMAVIVVCIELASFESIYVAFNNYYVATVLSFIIGVILNWICSRKFVFGASEHHPAKEFTMVLIASLVGVVIQVTIVGISVNILTLYPLVGKIISIFFSFFWNYWFRARFIFR